MVQVLLSFLPLLSMCVFTEPQSSELPVFVILLSFVRSFSVFTFSLKAGDGDGAKKENQKPPRSSVEVCLYISQRRAGE